MAQRAHLVFRFLLPLCLPFGVFVRCDAQDAPPQNVVARVEEQYITTFSDLAQYVRDYGYDLKNRPNPAKAYADALEDMTLNQMKRIDFFALGLDGNTELTRQITRSINEELVVRYYQTQFYGKYINEESMQQAYRKMGREVSYQQVIIGKPRNASRMVMDSLKALAKTIRKRMDKGEDAGTLAREYSRGSTSVTTGPVQQVNWKMSFSDNASYAVFDLPVDESRLFEGSESFQIVKVVKVDTRDVGPYASVKDEIRQALEGRYADVSYEEFEQAKQNLLDERTAKWNSQSLRQLVRWSNVPRFYQTSYADTFRNALARGRNIVILTSPTTRVDLKEYLRLVNNVLVPGAYDSVDQDELKKFILEAVRTSMIVDKAIALGLGKEVLTPAPTSPVLKSGIVRMYNRHEIEDRIPAATEPALKEFYRANQESLYYQMAKVNVYAIVDARKSAVEGLKETLARNIPFEKLATEVLVKTYIRRRDGTLATYFGNEPPYLAEAAFALKLNEVAGPVEFDDPAKGKQYALIKCVGVQEAKQLSWSDVQPSIADDFATFHRQQITLAVRDRLKKKYSVTIYRDVLRKNMLSAGINP